MENLQLTDDLKQAFESINLPEIDVSDSVINSIKNARFRNPEKKKVLAISLLAAALFIVASAFAARNLWILRDENNNIVLQYLEFNEESQIPLEIEADVELKSLIDNLEPGKAIFYYDARQTKANDTGKSEIIIITYSKPVKYTDMDVLIAKSGLDFAIPYNIPAGYAFSKGYITFDPLPIIDHNIVDKLIEETINSGKNIATAEWETSSKARKVSLVYKNADTDKEFTVRATVFEGEYLYTNGYKNSFVEKTTLNGREVLYVEKEDGVREIIMRELYSDEQSTGRIYIDGKGLSRKANSYIHYTISSKDMSKDELLNIAQSMIR